MSSFDFSGRSIAEPSGEEFRAAVETALTHLIQFLDSQATSPAIYPSSLSTLQKSAWSEQGTSLEKSLLELFHERLEFGLNPANPGYLAFIPGGGLPIVAVADLIAGIINRYVGLFRASPKCAALEGDVIRWFCQWIGYSDDSGGTLTSGGSIANWTAITTARMNLLGEDFSKGTVYFSEQTHHSIEKSLILAGIPRRNIRKIKCDSDFRINIEDLKREIASDQQEGKKPFIIVGNAGTTNTGAIDSLKELSLIASDCGAWFHIDAAYGGFFVLSNQKSNALQELKLGDSVTMDPHKSLFFPYGTGCLLVKDRKRLMQTHDLRGEYMSRTENPWDGWDMCDHSPEQTRPFRALRVWLAIQTLGLDTFRKLLDEKVTLTKYAYEELLQFRATEGKFLELINEPELTVLAMRLNAPAWSAGESRRHTESLLAEINSSGEVYLSPTLIDGKAAFRMCILGLRTHRESIELAIGRIKQGYRKVMNS